MILNACLDVSHIILYDNQVMAIPTGIAVEIPIGFEGQVRSRSGLAVKHGIFVLNSPGTIDCDYRGELIVILTKIHGGTFNVNHGDRIAQLVISPVMNACQVDVVEELGETKRGEGRFGSTGI
jgi:dUTP pyrophosphatase